MSKAIPEVPAFPMAAVSGPLTRVNALAGIDQFCVEYDREAKSPGIKGSRKQVPSMPCSKFSATRMIDGLRNRERSPSSF